ncbi:Abnormal spindle-like microcephaly-associated protein-like protein [Nibea albiflora]|uniref:Abnormal spindle-like microcephaly-associated protein-like protein n=1 Tax=Nibea albiflora TaxID=240163 RepID=A0ACB7ENG6_NIBAL|nr:Abnormal spindle-like microcephaly-associated protein-like protein [Nibea albiflora]
MSETIAPTRRGGFLDISPGRRDDGNKENDVPVLSLIQFSKAPFLTFGAVKLGTSKSAVLRIENPTEDAEAEVTVEKIPSSRGFSVDHSTFTIQPEGSFSLTVTWTPADEGGIRELIIFNANGVLKHQAVLLGRAEAPKKKKKSLWDKIKNKQEGEKVTAPRRKITEQPLKMAANKTFQVPRKSQYKREKPRSPLASLNEGKAVRERSLSKHSPIDDYPQKPEALNPSHRQRSLGLSDQENIHHVQRNSPLVLLVPAGKLMDSGNMSASPDALKSKPENKDLTKIFNRTLSPIGTPEMFKKLMPHIQLDSPHTAAVKSVADAVSSDSGLTGTPVLSLKDALALIDSDLSQVNTSPRDTSSSCGFSDSLESKSGNRGGNVLKELPDSPQGPESDEPRLTFFVNKTVVVSEVVVSAAEKVKKASFTSATVTKSKAPVEANSLSGRKIKKSRRRLLERTLELSDGSSQCESGPDTPSLPVIDADRPTKGRQSTEASSSPCHNRHEAQELTSSVLTSELNRSPTPITFPISSPASMAPARFSFSITSPPPAVAAPYTAYAATSLLPLGSSSPLHLNLTSTSNARELSPTVPTPLSIQEDSFPIHVAVKSKKRKSEEFLKRDGKAEDAGKTGACQKEQGGGWEKPSLQDPCRRGGAHHRGNSQEQQVSGREGCSVRSMTTSSLRTARSALPAQAKPPNTKVTPRDAPSLKSSAVSSVKAAKIVAVAQSKLTFIKPAQTAIPRHPMPFAAKNMFYDERWIEKQETGFTWWINYVLTPDDFKVNTEVATVNAVNIVMGSDDKFSVPKAPTKEEMSFSTYTARRKLNRLRRAACQLFTSEAMVKAIQRLELEVEAKRLLVRKDRHLWKDIGERRKVLNWLLSYNPLWLRIGLETIYGELISLESNSDALGLAMFILQRLLWNPDIAAQFRHAKVPHLYKDGHEEALSRFTLKKLLLLVCFLDKAKESRLIEHNPCLFCLDAEFKTSKDLLLAFSRDFLSGEGILPRHLGYLGLPVSHAQTPLDEFNFAVKNLAVDLKCGIRLVRVMELLIQDWNLSAKLRLPAISRLQKVHNVDVALQVLKSKGSTSKMNADLSIVFSFSGSAIDSRDVVDGHREKTLSLLWKIIFAFHVEVILDEEQLKEEIGFLKRTSSTKRRLASLRADRGLQPSPAKARRPYEHSSRKITLLMDWARAVCDFYSLKVENFTVTFSDGRVLCYLIHHYHPSLLPEEAVSHSTTQTVECSQRGRLELDCSASDSDNSFDSLAYGPRLSVVISYLSFLCARLLDLRNETRAARVIQGAWRKYRLKKDLQLYKERKRGCCKNSVCCEEISAEAQSGEAESRCRYRPVSLERLRRPQQAEAEEGGSTSGSAARSGNCHPERLQRTRCQKTGGKDEMCCRRNPELVQSLCGKRHGKAKVCEDAMCCRHHTGSLSWEGGSGRMKNQQKAATVLQAAFRKHAAQRRYLLLRKAAAVIQQKYRATVLARRTKEDYDALRNAALTIQANWRGRAVRKALEKQHRCAALIQAHYRRYKAQVEFRSKKAAAEVIQRRYKAYVAGKERREAYLRTRAACVTLQAGFRGMRVRTALKKTHRAATVIQSSVRMFLRRKQYVLLQSAAIIIQSRYRALVVCRVRQNEYRGLKQAAIKIQAVYRGFRVREDLKKKHSAARAIQAQFRMHRMRMAYLALKCAAIIIQERYRAKMLRDQQVQRYRAMKSAALVIQAAYRGHRARKTIAAMHRAAAIIQRKFFTIRDRNRFLALKAAALVCQRRYRAVTLARKDRLDYLSKRRAAICLQAAFRGREVRKQLRLRHAAAVTIQAHFRKHQQRTYYKRLRWAAHVIQARYRANMKMREDMQALTAKRNAAVVLQAAFRALKSRRILKQRNEAASVVQRAYRARCERKQAAFRGQQVRKEIACWHQAATVIQSAFRSHREEVKFQAMRLSAIIIQRSYRSCILQRQERKNFLKARQSAIVLQAAFRGHRVRSSIAKMHRAATVIQANFKRHRQQSAFRRQRWAACVLQQRFRAQRQRDVEIKQYQQCRRAAIVLQAAYRGMKSRQKTKQSHQAAGVIQRAYRAHCEHKQYLTLKSSVLTIQRRYRATRWVRARHQRRRYLEDRRKVVTAQRAVRRWLARRHQAASVIQGAVQKFLLLRRQKRVQQGIVKAQALWRGHRSRRLNDNPKLVKLRHQLRKISAGVREEDKLCNKTSCALDYLLRYKHFSYILEALKNLETATRLSPECCERLVESGATNVIFTLIRCCNRSVPCMDVITFSIQILLNLSKYHKTIDAVYSVENSVETLLDLLQRYREKAGDKVAEKGGSIFTKACFLLALLLQDKRRAVVRNEVMKLPKVLDRIRSIYRLTARKHKMDAERTVIKQKMNASINGSFFVQANAP